MTRDEQGFARGLARRAARVGARTSAGARSCTGDSRPAPQRGLGWAPKPVPRRAPHLALQRALRGVFQAAPMLAVVALALAWRPAAGAPAGPGGAAAPGVKAAATVAACSRWPSLRLLPLAPGLWWVPAAGAQAAAGDEATAHNRGQVSNLLLAEHQGQLWALGSGPSPAFGRALGCQARRQLGLPLLQVVATWARPEAVLGAAGVQRAAPAGAGVTLWAHQDVAVAMARQCAHCLARLRTQLGPAARDLGPADDWPVRLADHRLRGDHGTLGPWRWWRLDRSATHSTVLWRWQHGPFWFAPGLLWSAQTPPDGRDTQIDALLASSRQLSALAAADGAAARWLGEQGEPQDARAPQRLLGYWQGLRDAVLAAMAQGQSESAAASAWPGLPPDWAGHAWQALNWQRAWRQLEPDWLDGEGAGAP